MYSESGRRHTVSARTGGLLSGGSGGIDPGALVARVLALAVVAVIVISGVGPFALLGTTSAVTSVSGDDATTVSTTLTETNASDPVAADWPTLQYDAGRTGHDPTAAGPKGNVTLAWNVSADRGYHEPIVYGDTVVAISGLSILAHNASTGALQWKWTHPDIYTYRPFERTAPVFHDGRVYAITSEYLMGFNGTTGALEVATDYGNPLGDAYTPVVGENAAGEALIFFAQDDDPLPGEPSYVDGRVHGFTLDGKEVWNTSLRHWPTGPVAYANGTVYVENIWNVTALNATTGTVDWNVNIDDNLRPITVAGGRVYASATNDYTDTDPNDYLYALNASSGETDWRFNVSAQVGSTNANPTSVTTDGTTVYLGDSHENVHAVDATDGSLRWTRSYDHDHVFESFTLLDGVLYAESGRTVHALDTDSGAELWKYTLPDYINGLAHSDGRILVGYGVPRGLDAYGLLALHEGVHYSDIAASPSDIGIGESTTISVTVRNPQAAARTYTAKLTIDGIVRDRQTGTLASGASTTVSFTRTFPYPGSYTVAIGNHQSQTSASPVAITVGPLPTGEWPSLRGNPRGTGVADVVPPVGNVSVLWSTETDAYDYDFTSPVVSDGLVFFMGVDENGESGGLAAYDAGSGEEYWSVGEELYSTPTVHNGTVYASVYDDGDEMIYAMDASRTKNRRWAVDLGDTTYYQGSITVWNGTVLVPAYSAGVLVALDAEDGSLEWRASVEDDLDTTPAVDPARGLVYVGDDDGYVYAHAIDSGTEVWRHDLGTDVTSPAVVGGTVHVTVDNELYALNASTGAVEWNRTVPNNPEDSAVAVDAGRVFVGADGGFYAYDAATGDPVWNYTAPAADFRPPAIGSGVVYTVDQYEALFGFDAVTGDVLVAASGFDPEETPAIADDYVYTYGYVADYSLVALREVAPTASLRVDGSGVFGEVTVGTTSTREITIENDGGDPIELADTSVVGTDSGAFSVTGGGSVALASGETVNLTVTFAPTTIGDRTATLRVTTNASVELAVDLSGTGIGGISLDPTAIDFGDVVTGTTATESVNVTNDRDSSIEIDGATLSGSDAGAFDLADSVPFTLAAGESRALTVSFSPTARGAMSATLTLTTNDTGVAPLEVTLSGAGTAPRIDVAPTTVAFDNTSIGEATSRNLTVTNIGDAGLTVSGVTVSGAAFSVESTAGFTLGPTESRILGVTFAPASVGTHTGTLTLTSDDPDEPTRTVSLSGLGGAPDVLVSGTTVDLGDVTVGGERTVNLTVTNNGSERLAIDPPTVTGPDASAFSVSPSIGLTLDPGETVIVSVTFAPATAGEKTATLALSSSDPDTPEVSVTLSGTGVDDTPTPTSTDVSTVSPGQPGFDILAALVALGAGLLARRRRR